MGAKAYQEILDQREEVRLVIHGRTQAPTENQKIEVVIKKAYALLIGAATLIGPVVAVFVHSILWKSGVDAKLSQLSKDREQALAVLRLETERTYVKRTEFDERWERWTLKLEGMSATLNKLDGFMSARESKK